MPSFGDRDWPSGQSFGLLSPAGRINETNQQMTHRTDSYWQFDAPGQVTIPVAKPRLPFFEEIAPYLRRIEQSQWYSNGGPLVQEFERRLESHIGGDGIKVATVGNATIGLALTLLAFDPPPGSLCMVPAWTFAATAHAIQLAGLIPWIVDVDLASWALEPEAAMDFLRDAPGTVSAVVPVSPFGAPIETESWQLFHEKTGLAVVIDAAAAFDTVEGAGVPAVVSLHATKVLGVGEGGFVVATDGRLIEEIQKRANFGFWNSREATARSFNGKMSEYTAAVGLAGLDAWDRTRADFVRVGSAYGRGLAKDSGVKMQREFAEKWITSTIVVTAPKIGAEVIARSLSASGIGSRRWWGGGLHRHRAFEKCPRLPVVNCDSLVDSVIGLPCWRDLSNDDIDDVCEVVLAARP